MCQSIRFLLWHESIARQRNGERQQQENGASGYPNQVVLVVSRRGADAEPDGDLWRPFSPFSPFFNVIFLLPFFSLKTRKITV